MRLLTPIAAMLTLTVTASCDQPLPTAATSQAPETDAVLARALNQGHRVVVAVTGSGHYTNNAGNRRTLAFEVKETSDGTVHGTFQLTGHARPPNRSHGPLTCLSVVGDEAWIGGVYESSGNPSLVGTGFWFYVRDNGEGHGATPDLVRRHVRSGNADDCASRPDPGTEFLYPIEAGNIQVHRE
jgi:hypothetical protein